jgi:hypothetical protein
VLGNGRQRESLLHEIIHGNDLIPVIADLLQSERFAEVDEIQDILLEAGTAESNEAFRK